MWQLCSADWMDIDLMSPSILGDDLCIQASSVCPRDSFFLCIAVLVIGDDYDFAEDILENWPAILVIPAPFDDLRQRGLLDCGPRFVKRL